MSEIVDPAVERYATSHSSPEPAHLVHVAAETRRLTTAPGMMVGATEGAFLRFLVAFGQPTRILEIGTFTGYSALSMAPALRPDARIITCEVDPRHAEIARRHIEEAGFAEAIEIRLGPALETIDSLEGPFDLVFIDADKAAYGAYFDAALPLLSDQGLIVIDNVLQDGRVLDPASDERGRRMDAFNRRLAEDPRIECVMLPIRDGVTLARRRASSSKP